MNTTNLISLAAELTPLANRIQELEELLANTRKEYAAKQPDFSNLLNELCSSGVDGIIAVLAAMGATDVAFIGENVWSWGQEGCTAFAVIETHATFMIVYNPIRKGFEPACSCCVNLSDPNTRANVAHALNHADSHGNPVVGIGGNDFIKCVDPRGDMVEKPWEQQMKGWEPDWPLASGGIKRKAVPTFTFAHPEMWKPSTWRGSLNVAIGSTERPEQGY